MSDRPWFKAYASDILTDATLDSLPPEALGIILKMWCVCHIEGQCPSDPNELARKTRLPVAYVLKYESYIKSLFDSYNDSYVSERMERERKRSEINRANVGNRYKDGEKKGSSTIRSTNGSSNYTTSRIESSDYDNDSVLDLELKVLEVAKVYPRIGDPMNLASIHQTVISEALVRHGDKVLAGTIRFRECYDRWPKDQQGFASGVEKFFRTSEYLLEPVDRSNGNSKLSLSERNKRAFDTAMGRSAS